MYVLQVGRRRESVALPWVRDLVFTVLVSYLLQYVFTLLIGFGRWGKMSPFIPVPRGVANDVNDMRDAWFWNGKVICRNIP